MDTHLAMNGVKSSSFSVKDLLDLPEKDACSPGVGSPGDLLVAGDVGPAPPAYYDPTDNPYTRWLHANEYHHSKLIINIML